MRQLILLSVIAVVIGVSAATALGHPLMTKSQARVVVRDVNLKPADMPGYDSIPSGPPSSGDRQSDARLTRCIRGIAVSRALATGSSPVFVRGPRSDFDIFGSVVAVFPKAALVRADLRALRTARARECLRSAVERSASSSGKAASVTAVILHTAVRGVFGYRFITEFPSTNEDATYSDFFYMGTRAGEARVIVNAHPSAPAQSLDDRVVRIVKTRLDARLDPNTLL